MASREEMSTSFGAASGIYELGRPGYPSQAVEWMLHPVRDEGRALRVADVGAGTGTLTRAAVELGAEVVAIDPDPAMLAEYARQALGRTITAPFLDHEGTLRVIALDPQLEQAMAEALVQTADGEFLAMDPNLAAMVVDSAAEQVEQAIGAGGRPVLLCSARVRRTRRMRWGQRHPHKALCSCKGSPPANGGEATGVFSAATAVAV